MPSSSNFWHITPRQKEAYDIIAKEIHLFGNAPTERELAAQLGVYRGAAHQLIRSLIKRGWLVRDTQRGRALRLVEHKYET